jgi:cytochrome c556
MRKLTARHLLAVSLVSLIVACSGGDATDPGAEGAGAATASGEAPPILKEREGNFEAIGKAFKAVRGQLESDSPDFALIAASAADINTRAGKITGHFPAGTSTADGFKTEALPVIWEKPEEFKAAAQKLVDESAKLASLAPGGDKAAVGAQAMAMGGACKGCHDTFRLDDEKK